jgi:hypothetical protein
LELDQSWQRTIRTAARMAALAAVLLRVADAAVVDVDLAAPVVALDLAVLAVVVGAAARAACSPAKAPDASTI